MWNKAMVIDLLNSSDRAVNRAMIAIYNRQTRDEQREADTKHTNKVGFSAAHARRGSYYGRWCKSGRCLTGRHLINARKIALHYAQQLADEANAKAARRNDIEREAIQSE